MQTRQPDERIGLKDLGMLVLDGKRFVVNLSPGVPFNACIEEVDESLRCWASHRWLDDEAALFVYAAAQKNDSGAFVWDEDVKAGNLACVKGDWALLKVIIP